MELTATKNPQISLKEQENEWRIGLPVVIQHDDETKPGCEPLNTSYWGGGGKNRSGWMFISCLWAFWTPQDSQCAKQGTGLLEYGHDPTGLFSCSLKFAP